MTKNARVPKYDWEFYTEPQVYANNRQIQSSRGKGLGGSSALNNLAFVRPVSEELDAFEQLGNPGWNWNNLLEYMKKVSLSDKLVSHEFKPSLFRASISAFLPCPTKKKRCSPLIQILPSMGLKVRLCFMNARLLC